MSEMSMVERLAKALYEADGNREGWPWDRSILGGKDYWMNRARIAINVMRYRSKSMIAATDQAFYRDGKGMREAWEAQIDAALKD